MPRRLPKRPAIKAFPRADSSYRLVVVSPPPKLLLLMVISPGELTLALHSLQRARDLLSRLPASLDLAVVWNQADEPPPELRESAQHLIRPPEPAPYVGIGKLIFWSLTQIPNPSGYTWVVKIDPDTLVCNADFGYDLLRIHEENDASMVAHFTTGQSASRNLRMKLDALPFGLSRDAADGRTYGRRRLRLQPCWYSPLARRAWQRGHDAARTPAGGFYALRGETVAALQTSGWCQFEAPYGTEWNDDAILPMLLTALKQSMYDLATSPMAEGWRHMHGSRYFDEQVAQDASIRAVHPLKDTPEDWAIREAICGPHSSTS